MQNRTRSGQGGKGTEQNEEKRKAEHERNGLYTRASTYSTAHLCGEKNQSGVNAWCHVVSQPQHHRTHSHSFMTLQKAIMFSISETFSFESDMNPTNFLDHMRIRHFLSEEIRMQHFLLDRIRIGHYAPRAATVRCAHLCLPGFVIL